MPNEFMPNEPSLQRLPGRVGEAFPGRGEHAEQLDAVAGAYPVVAAAPSHGGLADHDLATYAERHARDNA